MHVLVTGASGLVGRALVPFLTTGGHTVTRLVRSSTRPVPGTLPWNPATRSIPTPALEDLDAVVHLAGENIAAKRWTPAQKAQIRDSRVEGTRLLCEALAQLVHPPKVLVCASAIGYYGHRGDRVLREESPPGRGFLAEVCQAWEAAAAPAVQRGLRVVFLRFGVILHSKGGALEHMIGPVPCAVGGTIGPGTQYISWITLDDAIGALDHALRTDTVRGPVNVVAPHPVTNADFTKTLAHVLRRRLRIPLPAFAARLLLGDMVEDLLLASTRVAPERLLASGYTFRFPELEAALQHLLHPAHAAPGHGAHGH